MRFLARVCQSAQDPLSFGDVGGGGESFEPRVELLIIGPSVAITMSCGVTSTFPQGPTLLEISRMKGVPHTSVCGGSRPLSLHKRGSYRQRRDPKFGRPEPFISDIEGSGFYTWTATIKGDSKFVNDWSKLTLVQPVLGRVLEGLQERLFSSMHYQNAILKARQLGFTTFIQLFMLDACVFNSNVRAGTIARNLEDAKAIFRDKVKYPYDSLPEGIKAAVAPVRNAIGKCTSSGWRFCITATPGRSSRWRSIVTSVIQRLFH